MGAGIKIKHGSYSTGRKDRDAGKRKKRLIILTLAGCFAGNVIATQYIADTMKYAAALGAGFPLGGGVKLYAPVMWLPWIMRLIEQYTLDNELVSQMFAVAFFAVLICTFLPAAIMKSQEKARKEREKLESLHGSARWAEIDDIRDAGLLPPAPKGGIFNKKKPAEMTGVYVGGFEDPKRKDVILYLKHNGPEHILVYAPTRSGKGVGLVLPSLLNWPESCIVLDIKGENFALTAGWRRDAINNYILKFDPVDVTGNTARYNPLNEIRIGTEYEHADVENLALMLADPTGKGSEGANAHWVNTASSLLLCLIFHMIFKCKAEGTEPTFEMLRSMFTAPDEKKSAEDMKPETEEAAEAANEFKDRVLKVIMTYNHNPNVDVSGMSEEELARKCDKKVNEQTGQVLKWPELYRWEHDDNGNPCEPYYTRYDFDKANVKNGNTAKSPRRTHPKAAENANEAYQRPGNEGGSVLSTAANALKLYADPTISRNLKNATFRLNDLTNADHPVSLYLVIPPAQLGRLIPIMRILITQVVTVLADQLDFVKGQTRKKNHHRMLLMLDEFPTLGNMENLDIGGYNASYYAALSTVVFWSLVLILVLFCSMSGIVRVNRSAIPCSQL